MSCKYVFGIIELILRETTNRELIFLLVFTSISKFKKVNESDIHKLILK